MTSESLIHEPVPQNEALPGSPAEVSPGVYELTVEDAATKADQAFAATEGKLAKAVQFAEMAGMDSTELAQSLKQSEQDARRSLAEILGTEAEIDAALAGLESAAPEALQGIEYADTLKLENADTIRTASLEDTPTIKITASEDYPVLPNQYLTELMVGKGIDGKTVAEVDELLKTEMAETYNSNMTLNQVPAIMRGMSKIAEAKQLGMSDAVISGIIQDMKMEIPRSSIQTLEGSRMEKIMAVNAVLPDAWQTAKMRNQLTAGEQLPVLADLQEKLGSEKIRSFLESLPQVITSDESIMQALFSQESAKGLSLALQSSDNLSGDLMKIARIAKSKPYIIPRILQTESYQTVKTLLDTYSLGAALGKSDNLERELGKIIDLQEPQKPSDLKSLRMSYKAAE